MAMDLLYLIIFQSGCSVGRQVEEAMIMKGEGLEQFSLRLLQSSMVPKQTSQ